MSENERKYSNINKDKKIHEGTQEPTRIDKSRSSEKPNRDEEDFGRTTSRIKDNSNDE